MGNEYNRFNNHHHHHYHSQHLHNLHRSTFLPMLCSKPSIKDVRIPKSGVFKEDPISPRISCMGQVKRGNKVNGFPTSHRLTITTTNSSTNSPTTNHHHNNHNFKYSKLKKLFSAKNLTAITTTTISTTTISTTTSTTRCRRSGPPRINGHHCVGTDLNLVDLDPPLPVIKREAQEEDQVESLWKRRSGGAALQGLQLKLTPHPRHQNQPTTV